MEHESANLPDWLPERLERAKKTAIREFLSELGFEEADALKQTLEAGTQHQATIQQLTEEKNQAVQRATEAESQHRQLRLEMAFQQAIAPYNFINPQEARTLADLSGVQMDENFTGMKEAIETLVESRPHLLQRQYTPPMESHAGRELPAAEDNTFTPQEVDSIKRRFRMLW